MVKKVKNFRIFPDGRVFEFFFFVPECWKKNFYTSYQPFFEFLIISSIKGIFEGLFVLGGGGGRLCLQIVAINWLLSKQFQLFCFYIV